MKRVFMNKRWAVVLLCMVMVISIIGCEQQEEKGITQGSDSVFEAGTYEGIGKGYGGDIKVAVTVDKQKIVEVKVNEHGETAGVSDPAFSKLPAQIVEYQTVALDAISGCTTSSKGILEAAKNALLTAGATEADITKAPEIKQATGETIKKTVDVVVIGSGGAGMSAAYEVAKAGGSVIVVEKNSSVGGNTILAGSAMNAANPEKQKKLSMGQSELNAIKGFLALEPKNELMEEWQKQLAADIEKYESAGDTYLYDSPALHKLQTYVDGDYVGNPQLINILGDSALGSVNFLTSLGAKWTENITAAVGATWARSHTPTQDLGSAGASFVLPQYNAVKELGGEIYLEHKAEALLFDNGKAVGVKGTTNDGTAFEFLANKGVVLATGGFGANVEMRQKYNKHWESLDESVGTTNGPWATGDGIVMAEAVGANLIDMEWIQLVPTGTVFIPSINNTIFVNTDGERFIKEDDRRDKLSEAILQQPGKYFYSIVDTHTTIDELNGIAYTGKAIEDMVDGKKIFKADTIAELAAQIKIDPKVLQATVDEFNTSVETRKDEFGRALFDKKLDKGPFYAAQGFALVHHTMGGVEINEKTQVLDTNGKVIENLYAAGEVAGGIHGGNRLGGNAISDIVTFGRIAGQEIMK